MPHLDVKYKPDVVRIEDLAELADTLTKIVGTHFNENPDFVSLEMIPQGSVVRNRKDVDLELDSAPDPEGLRARVAGALSQALSETVGEHLKSRGYENLEISGWVRIFDTAVYHYHRA
ncbi:hypothetical protein [Actinoplanes sp. CA-252034]|uniref:hypothetical protein n=1 Tax=Actinoplanes sp. CA-252034 TaxID=3239906 RepID=UPI003D956307